MISQHRPNPFSLESNVNRGTLEDAAQSLCKLKEQYLAIPVAFPHPKWPRILVDSITSIVGRGSKPFASTSYFSQSTRKPSNLRA